ncbi:MAG: protein jag [Oscillospiraceae bacterium]|nr:protein jag [Oscillospiraceae bacterium]
MIKSIEKSAKTEDLAIAAALQELGLSRDDVTVEILERAKSGFLGFGASPAKVKVSYEVPDEVVAEPAPVAAEAVTVEEEAQCENTAHEKVYNFVIGLLEHMGVRANIEITEKEDGGINVNLSGKGMGVVIGRRGETLDAIQHLTNYAVNHGSEKRLHVSVDAEAYRAKREEALVRLAEKMAAKAIKYKRSMALEPMNSYERHVIHAALQDYEGVSTSSIGTEPNRRVVVAYEKPQQEVSNKPKSREWA